jgi:hypothetical protein
MATIVVSWDQFLSDIGQTADRQAERETAELNSATKIPPGLEQQNIIANKVNVLIDDLVARFGAKPPEGSNAKVRMKLQAIRATITNTVTPWTINDRFRAHRFATGRKDSEPWAKIVVEVIELVDVQLAKRK